jgi:hypothetical protein
MRWGRKEIEVKEDEGGDVRSSASYNLRKRRRASGMNTDRGDDGLKTMHEEKVMGKGKEIASSEEEDDQKEAETEAVDEDEGDVDWIPKTPTKVKIR